MNKGMYARAYMIFPQSRIKNKVEEEKDDDKQNNPINDKENDESEIIDIPDTVLLNIKIIY